MMQPQKVSVAWMYLLLALISGLALGFCSPKALAIPPGTLAFLSDRNSKPPRTGSLTTVYLVETDGSHERVWLENPKMSFHRFSWSRDGRWVAFDMQNMSGSHHVFVLDTRTGVRKNMTAPLAKWGTRYKAPSLSGDGKWLVLSVSQIPFAPDDDGTSDIYIMGLKGWGIQDLVGTGLRNVTRFPQAMDYGASWSPDASRIAFVSNREREGKTCIYTMDRNGQNVVQLTADFSATAPEWSPDGQKIAFYSNEGQGRQSEVYVMNADGTGVVNLSRHPAEDRFPSWSPDGAWMTFMSNRDNGSFDVYIMDANGNHQTRVTDHPGSVFSPVWVPARGVPDAAFSVNPFGKQITLWGSIKSEK